MNPALADVEAFLTRLVKVTDWEAINGLPPLTIEELLSHKQTLEDLDLPSISRALSDATARLNGFPLALHARTRIEAGLWSLMAGKNERARRLLGPVEELVPSIRDSA